MNRDLLTTVILEQQAIVSQVKLVPREFRFEEGMNYVLVGLRRAGKSFLLYQRIQELLASGVTLEQIIYVNFEDERLVDFSLADFDSLVVVANQLSPKKHYYFFDEIQNIAGWERFARRMADQKEFVYLTGSNSKMLGQEIALRLGGRYLTRYVPPFRFGEFLTAKQLPHDRRARLVAQSRGQINAALDEYLRFGGLPEAIRLVEKRNYLNDLYQNIYLADIIVRNHVQNPAGLRLMIRKLAETVMHEISYNRLYTTVKATGLAIGKNVVADYTAFAQTAYLLFVTRNYFSKFAARESTPRYYFSDNGLLSIFLTNKEAALLENLVAIQLFNQFQNQVYYLKSSKTGIDIDFYLPEKKMAIQVAWTIAGEARQREVGNLVKLKQSMTEVERLVIVTKDDPATVVEKDGVQVEVVPLVDFLLDQHHFFEN